MSHHASGQAGNLASRDALVPAKPGLITTRWRRAEGVTQHWPGLAAGPFPVCAAKMQSKFHEDAAPDPAPRSTTGPQLDSINLATSCRHSEHSPTSIRSPPLTTPVKFVMVTECRQSTHQTLDSRRCLASAGMLRQSLAAGEVKEGRDSTVMSLCLVWVSRPVRRFGSIGTCR